MLGVLESDCDGRQVRFAGSVRMFVLATNVYWTLTQIVGPLLCQVLTENTYPLARKSTGFRCNGILDILLDLEMDIGRVEMESSGARGERVESGD